MMNDKENPMPRVREYTIRIREHVESGFVDAEDILNSILDWMSEDQVREMYLAFGWNEPLDGEDPDEEDEDDGE